MKLRSLARVQSTRPRLSIQSPSREARFKCLRLAPLSRAERNASIIFTVRQKRNLVVDKDRRGKAESGSRKKGREEGAAGERVSVAAMGPPDLRSLVFFPPFRSSPLRSLVPPHPNETRSSHVTLNWSIISQSSSQPPTFAVLGRYVTIRARQSRRFLR